MIIYKTNSNFILIKKSFIYQNKTMLFYILLLLNISYIIEDTILHFNQDKYRFILTQIMKEVQ